MIQQIKERCIYCGGDVYYSGTETLIKCSMCGHTLVISKLKDLTNLKYLDLAGNEISDISAIKSLKKLEMLDLADNPISDYSPIEGLDIKYPY